MATTHARLREALPRAGELALLCAARGIACVAAWNTGFRALSDDDYARLSIAQRFAAAPRFDPSGTSWLPAPFWLYGAAFRGFGTNLAVARTLAIALSVAATVLVYSAARVLGACRPGSLLSAALSALLPYSALLGVAALPEVPCAALLVFGAATVATQDPKLRAFGGAALSAACLARYEAWPAALVFAVCGLWSAYRQRSPALVSGAALALAGPVLWLAVGKVEHGQALFFVTRVTAYRHALGGPSAGSLGARLLEYPRLLLLAEPELWGLLGTLVAFGARAANRQLLAPYRRAALPVFSVLAFLMLGGVHEGVPTHHAARVLLPVWFFVCIACGHGLGHVFARSSSARRISLASAGASITVALFWVRPKLLPHEGFAERRQELAIGAGARRSGATSLAIDTADYGYFAVQVGFGAPQWTFVLDDHDPRRPRPVNPFASAEALDSALRALDAQFLISTAEHSKLVSPRCNELWKNPGYVLFQCEDVAVAQAAGP